MQLRRSTTTGPSPLSYLTNADDDADDARVPVVFLHGVFDSAQCWSGVIAAVPGMRAYALDTRGHGATPLYDGDLRIPTLAEDVAGFIAGLGAGPAILVGHSMGGLIAYETATRHPELVRALMLVDAPLDVGSDIDPHLPPASVAERLEQIATWSAADLMAKGRADHPTWDDDEFTWWAAAKDAVDRNLLTARQQWGGGGFEHLGAVAAPAVFVAGAPARGSMVTAGQLDRARAAWGERGVAVLDRAGHDVHKDDRAAFVAVLEDFLRRVSP